VGSVLYALFDSTSNYQTVSMYVEILAELRSRASKNIRGNVADEAELCSAS
jgi:hypothetical protein